MSYTIFKTFSIKDGKCNYNAASSNWRREERGLNGRVYQSLVFSKGEQDYRVKEKFCQNVYNQYVPNPRYDWSDIKLYAQFLLRSIYGGDKFYQQKHKVATEAIGAWAENKREIDRENFAKRANISVDKLKQEMYCSDFDKKYGAYNDVRIYTDPTPDELDELVTIVEKAIKNFKNTNKRREAYSW